MHNKDGRCRMTGFLTAIVFPLVMSIFGFAIGISNWSFFAIGEILGGLLGFIIIHH